MESTATNGGAKILTSLIIGLLVGFAMGVFWQDRRSGDDTQLSKEKVKVAEEKEGTVKDTARAVSTLTDSETVKVVSTDLVVADQLAGTQVMLQGFDATEVLWVAVREEKEGIVGNILGASKVFAGLDQNVTVELLRPTVSGNTYRVVLYRDVGTADFNHKEDVLVSGREGKFVAK